MQKSQFILHPTCDDTQIVSLSSSGMVTVSINLPVAVLNNILRVPSTEVLTSNGSVLPTSYFSEIISLFLSEILVISSILFTRFMYTQSAICLAVNLGRLSSVTHSLISACVIPRKYFFCSIYLTLIELQRYGGFNKFEHCK